MLHLSDALTLITLLPPLNHPGGDNSQPRYTDAMLHLSDAVAEGRVRHLGVTNFDVPHLKKVVDAGVKVATNQVGMEARQSGGEGMAEHRAVPSIWASPIKQQAGRRGPGGNTHAFDGHRWGEH